MPKGGSLIYQYGFIDENNKLPEHSDIDGPNSDIGSVVYYFNEKETLIGIAIEWPWSFDK